MSDVVDLKQSFQWWRTPAAERERTLATKWDRLSDDRKAFYDANPGLWEAVHRTEAENRELVELHSRLGREDYASEGERLAMDQRRVQLDTYRRPVPLEAPAWWKS